MAGWPVAFHSGRKAGRKPFCFRVTVGPGRGCDLSGVAQLSGGLQDEKPLFLELFCYILIQFI